MTSERNTGGSIRRSRAILKAAFGALRRNPRLAWFPVLSGLGMLVLLSVGGAIVHVGQLVTADPVAQLGPWWSLLGDPNPDPETTLSRSLTVGGIVLYVGGHLLMVHMGVAMTHAALEALAGRPWTVRQAMAVASTRRRAIVGFAIIQAVVGHLLRGRGRDRKGRRRGPGLLTTLARVAWWAATYLVLPVIAREGRSGLRAIERSATLLRETWKETLVARLTMGWLWIPAVIIGAVPTVTCVVLGVRQPAVIALAVIVPLVALGVFGLFIRTLDGIYRAALYSYASEGVVPEAFVGDELDEIWEVSSRDAASGGHVPARREVIDATASDAEPDDDEPSDDEPT